jgi:hypothetical protein
MLDERNEKNVKDSMLSLSEVKNYYKAVKPVKGSNMILRVMKKKFFLIIEMCHFDLVSIVSKLVSTSISNGIIA